MASEDSGNSAITQPNLNGPGQEEPVDILSAFLEVVYNYVPITQAEAGSTFVYTYTGPKCRVGVNDAGSGEEETHRWATDPIKLTLHTPDTQPRNWELHAPNIWAASLFLADHIGEIGLRSSTCFPEYGGQDIKSYRRFEVLELGAGAGLLGLLAAKYLERLELDAEAAGEIVKSWRITLSDYPDDLLIATLRGNVQANRFVDSPPSSGLTLERGRARVVPYAWGQDVSSLLLSRDDNVSNQGFDLVIAADTLWNAALHGLFARTLYLVLRRTPDARVHLVAGLHTGRYVLSGFLRIVRSIHLSMENCVGLKSMSKARLDIMDISERQVNSGGRRDWREERESEDDRERRR